MNNDNFLHDRDVKASDVVCSHIYKIYGEDALRFIDPELIKVINFLSHTVFKNQYILINNYKGSDADIQSNYEEFFYEERGLRCNLCKSSLDRTRSNDMIMEPHILGKAIDFNVYDTPEDFTSREPWDGQSVLSALETYSASLPSSIRVDWTRYEWCHIDVLGMLGSDTILQKLGVDKDSEIRKMSSLYMDNVEGYAPENLPDQEVDETSTLGTPSVATVGNIDYTYKGSSATRSKSKYQKLNDLWNGKVPVIEDSTTPVSSDPGAKGTPPAWIIEQLSTFKVGKFSITVHKKLESDVKNIINEIQASGYNLKSVGSFSFRRANNGKRNQKLSNHGTAAAIDINAYCPNGFTHGGAPHKSGDDMNPGHIYTNDHPVVKIFAKYGWGWGGRYGDYMHFSLANGS